ncbi:MAG TPA: GNAT family N-acetyltransferase [Feifaniaceae bacterium]|nr:GNAT family N-acetyltransferase [Feifaniaceae bacterium]
MQSCNRILMQKAGESDLEALNVLYREAIRYFAFDPTHLMAPPEVCLLEGDLPPNGKREQFIFNGIYEGDTLIGYTTFYCGYPQADTLYLCFLYLGERRRGCGYGKQTVELLAGYGRDMGMKRMLAAVSLKNWYGIRFWHSAGFQRLTRVSLEGPFSQAHYGCIELERSL